jgi:hypothetical protein
MLAILAGSPGGLSQFQPARGFVGGASKTVQFYERFDQPHWMAVAGLPIRR